jgi:hypothetical protein
MTLKAAREAIAAELRAKLPREANVLAYELGDESPIPFPRIFVEFTAINYYQTLGTCSRAEVFGNIVIETANATQEDVNNVLDEYVDPFASTSVVAVLMAQAALPTPFGGAMQTFLATECQPREYGSRQVPFQFSLTRPPTS